MAARLQRTLVAPADVEAPRWQDAHDIKAPVVVRAVQQLVAREAHGSILTNEGLRYALEKQPAAARGAGVGRSGVGSGRGRRGARRGGRRQEAAAEAGVRWPAPHVATRWRGVHIFLAAAQMLHETAV